MDLRRIYEIIREEGAALFRHRTRGTVEPYVFIGTASAQCSEWNIQEDDKVAVYLSSKGELYVRHQEEFDSGRFRRAAE